MSRDTNKALSEITDEGLFEAVATAVLREAHPLCASLVHPGVNAEGKTRKAPVDAFTIISDNGTPHLVAVQHTITAAESLERKWLFDPSSSIPRKARSTRRLAGDLVKTASIVDAERSRTPQLLATLILTTNEEPGEELVRDVKAAAAPRRITIDIWSRSRIAHTLDNTPGGQWIRRSLGIESELLSVELLQELSRLSLERFNPGDDAGAWVPRALDGILARLRRPATFVVAESGHGKTVASYRALQKHIENGGAGLVLPHEVLEESTTLEAAIGEALYRLHPKLARGQSALEHCAPERPLVVVVEDINRSGQPQRLLEKLTTWTSGAGSPTTLRLLCPVWPRVLGSLSEQTRKAIEPMLLFPNRMTAEECREAVVLRAKQAGRDMSHLSADQLAARLGYDPLLIALHDYGTGSDPHDVIGGFVERALIRAQGQGAALAHTLRATLMQLAEQMLRRRRLDPSYAEVEGWELSDKQLQHIAQITRAEELIRLDGALASPRLAFRHDRVRDWLLVERAIELDTAKELSDDIVAEPFYAEIFGAVLVRCGAPSGLVERVSELNVLALFHALRLVGNNLSPRATLRAAIERWLADPATQRAANNHLRWHALAALEATDGDDIPVLVRRFPDTSATGYLAALHNGDVEAAVCVCAMFEFGTGATFRDRQIEHAKLHFGERFVTEISDWLLRLKDERDAVRRGLLELSGHLGEPALVSALEACWCADPSPDRRYQEYLWAFARCCADDETAARCLAPICDAWASLPDRSQVDHLPSPRDDFGADNLHWGFKRRPPTQAALHYFVARARQPELSRQIRCMLNEIDDPIVVQQIVDYATEKSRQSSDGSIVVLDQNAYGWHNPKNFELRYMSPRSRDPLCGQWCNVQNDPAQRKAAFRLWAATEGTDDLAVLRRLQGDALLGESILHARLVRGDTAAAPALIEKLREGEPGFGWWPLAPHVWSPGFIVELERTLDGRRHRAAKTWNETLDVDYSLTNLIARVPVHQGERILLRHWDHVRFSPRFVQLAFYLATPELHRLANECMKECPESAQLLASVSRTYGVRLAGHPGVNREAQLLVLEPHIHLLSHVDRSRLADACNEAGWYATRRRLFDKNLTNTFYAWKIDEASTIFDRLLGRGPHEIEYEVKRAMRTGVTWTEIYRALTQWLEHQESVDALRMVIEALIAHGSREDVASFHFAGEADAATVASLIADAVYAVRRRSLQ